MPGDVGPQGTAGFRGLDETREVGLMSLDVLGDPQEIRARAEAAIADLDLTPRPDGYQEGVDDTYSVRIAVDAGGEVADVTISPQWINRLPADRLGEAVLAAHHQANQKYAAIADRNRADRRLAEVEYPGQHDSEVLDIDDERWLGWVQHGLEQARRKLDDLVLTQQAPAVEEKTVEGPAGHVRLRARGTVITGVVINSARTAKYHPAAVAADLCRAFAEVRHGDRGQHQSDEGGSASAW